MRSVILFAKSTVKEIFRSIETSLIAFSRHLSFPPAPLFLLSLSLISDPFLCITPSLSTPIYSALPPPVFHKHTLYFSPLPSLGSPPVHYNTFPPLLPPLQPLYYLFVPFSGYVILHSAFLSLIFASHRGCHSVYADRLRCCCCCFPPLNFFFFFCKSKTYHLIWLLTVNPVGA